MLYQLSYAHHVMHSVRSVDECSGTGPGSFNRYGPTPGSWSGQDGPRPVIDPPCRAAASFEASVSGPGSGTKTVSR